jgi:small-conductance mechanosensitive channel
VNCSALGCQLALAVRAQLASASDLLKPASPLSVDALAEAFRRFAERVVERLPNLLAAVVLLAVAVLVARLVRRGVEAGLRRTSTEAYVHLLVAKLAYLGVLVVGMVVALSVVGVNLGVLVGSLGLATVAAGFALQDILSNFVAGIVLLLEHPFTKGDLIVTTDAQGEVEDIRVRATQLRTLDGQLVVVPNKLLFTNVLINASATTGRRLEAIVSVPYSQDSARIRETLTGATAAVEGVLEEPAPRVLTKDFGQGALELRLLFWVDPRASDLLRARSEVLEAIESALGEAGVDISVPQLTANVEVPAPTRQAKVGDGTASGA